MLKPITYLDNALKPTQAPVTCSIWLVPQSWLFSMISPTESWLTDFNNSFSEQTEQAICLIKLPSLTCWWWLIHGPPWHPWTSLEKHLFIQIMIHLTLNIVNSSCKKMPFRNHSQCQIARLGDLWFVPHTWQNAQLMLLYLILDNRFEVQLSLFRG